MANAIKPYSIFLRVSTVAKPRPNGAGASSQRRGSEKVALLPIFSGLSERNKMTEVLLRWPGARLEPGSQSQRKT